MAHMNGLLTVVAVGGEPLELPVRHRLKVDEVKLPARTETSGQDRRVSGRYLPALQTKQASSDTHVL